MDSAIKTALANRRPVPFHALKLVCGATTIRWLDGPGTISLFGAAFSWNHATYGVVAMPDDISEGASGESATLGFTIYPPSDSAARALIALLTESALVTVYGLSALNTATGAAVADPDTEFAGFVNVPSFTAGVAGGQGVCRVDVSCNGGMGYFLDAGDGMLMNDASHQAIRSGELGFQFLPFVQRQILWGSAGASPVVNTVTPAATSGRQSRRSPFMR